MLAFSSYDAEPPPQSSRTRRSSTCLLRANGVASIVDAIYADLEDEGGWRRLVTATAADALGRRNDLELHIVDRWVDATNDVAGMVRVVGHPDNDTSVVLSIPCARAARLSPYDRVTIARVALHLENAARFRRSPDARRSELSLDGEVIGPQRRPSVEHGRSAEEAELWGALVEGRAALVPRGGAGYRVLEGVAAWRSRRTLSHIELQSVVLAARGTSGKEVAYTLGVSTGRVCRALAVASAKVGAKAPSDLVRVAARLGIDDPPEVCDSTFTSAEREVLDLLRAGMSNEAIAMARGRSPRTIANQVASLLRKTGSGSRRALTAARSVPPPHIAP